MGNFWTQLLVSIDEGAYEVSGKIDLSNEPASIKTLGIKLGEIKALSQLGGEAGAVSFLQAHDSQLGPVAQQVVDALNGNVSEAVTAILGLLRHA